MKRILQPELLDALPPTDPRAIHSRRDLRRLNALMRNPQLITNFVAAEVTRLTFPSGLSIAEIGAGDGNIGLHVARTLSQKGFAGRLILVDQHPAPTEKNNPPNWSLETIQSDIFHWLARAEKVDVIIANLFLHHFEDEPLREMLAVCARLCRCFASAEPRRDPLAEWLARCVGLIGCNEVTRHDALISVRAGFRASEISALWPRDAHWQLTERRAGLASHFFGATRSMDDRLRDG